GFDLSEARREQAKADGVAVASSAAEAAAAAEVVITMLPMGAHVVTVWSEMLPAVKGSALVIDCSTIDVESARKAHAMAGDRALASVDAPVSGGVGGAREATLTFMAGGTPEAFARAEPILSQMGRRVVHCGEAGA